MLLQQRADSKYHSVGLWTNTCRYSPDRMNRDRLWSKYNRYYQVPIVPQKHAQNEKHFPNQ